MAEHTICKELMVKFLEIDAKEGVRSDLSIDLLKRHGGFNQKGLI